MNLKKRIREFFTLTRKANDGFTLVELIVVIAILAILSGIAVPAYSGYVTKANMQADISLVSELKDAAILGVLSKYNHEFAGPVVIKLSATEEPVVKAENADDKALVEGFIQAVYGENWAELCMLSYDGWTVNASDVFESYKGSSLYGKEDKLLDTTSTMSKNFANFLVGKSKPAQIEEMMNKYGYTDTDDTTTFANAAVLTLAKDFTEKKTADGVTMGDAVAAALASGKDGIMSLPNTMAPFYGTGDDDVDMRTLATTAALYAYATAFSEYAANKGESGAQEKMNQLNATLANDAAGMSSTAIMNAVLSTFASIADDAVADGTYNNYFGEGGQAVTDAGALMAVMGGVNESADALGENLSSADCYGEAKSLVNAYLTAGSVLDSAHPAGVVINADGSVASYLGGIR